MSRLLSDLDPAFLPLAQSLLEKCAEAGHPVAIVETRRSLAQHEANVKAGKSWTKRSRHCDGLAIDVCPKELINTPGWVPDSPVWETVGEIGEALGLRWGGRWKQRDMVHFEMREPVQPTPNPELWGEA